MRIGFDLDKVLINYPPLIPSKLIDWLYKDPGTKELHYRYPHTGFEKWLRQLSHFYWFRPKIAKNVGFINSLPEDSTKNQLFLISSRYSFLEEITKNILKRYGINGHFKSVHLNVKDEQPHLFKERVIRDLKLDLFIDDDLALLEHLKRTVPQTTYLLYRPKTRSDEVRGIKVLRDFDQLTEYISN